MLHNKGKRKEEILMKKGYIMIFLALWVIAVTIFIIFGIYKINSFLKDNKIEISRKNEEIQFNNEVISASLNESEEETTYIIREKNGYIAIYQVNEEGKELLREITQISTNYLPEIDKKKLKDGIKAIGREELNSIIEDYE